MIPVTLPFIPPKEDYDILLHGIWKRQWLTNMGPLASDLEMKLKEHLGRRTFIVRDKWYHRPPNGN